MFGGSYGNYGGDGVPGLELQILKERSAGISNPAQQKIVGSDGVAYLDALFVRFVIGYGSLMWEI